MNRRTFIMAAIGVAAQPTLNRATPAPERTQWDRLLDAIEQVESGGKADSVGDGGRAVGAYQIWTCYVDDCNRIMGQRVWSYKDRWDPVQSRRMVHCYLVHYGRAYERQTGLPVSAQVLARMHNGGPSGYRKACTLPYWKRVRAAMEVQ